MTPTVINQLLWQIQKYVKLVNILLSIVLLFQSFLGSIIKASKAFLKLTGISLNIAFFPLLGTSSAVAAMLPQ